MRRQESTRGPRGAYHSVRPRGRHALTRRCSIITDTACSTILQSQVIELGAVGHFNSGRGTAQSATAASACGANFALARLGRASVQVRSVRCAHAPCACASGNSVTCTANGKRSTPVLACDPPAGTVAPCLPCLLALLRRAYIRSSRSLLRRQCAPARVDPAGPVDLGAYRHPRLRPVMLPRQQHHTELFIGSLAVFLLFARGGVFRATAQTAARPPRAHPGNRIRHSFISYKRAVRSCMACCRC